MKTAIHFIFLFSVLFSTNLFARDWYEKSCTPMQKDKDRTYYVGGESHKNHLHVGADFIHIRVNGGRGSKPMFNGNVNCSVLESAISGINANDFENAGAITQCLQAAKDKFC
jgi:hypothetical protein